MFFPWFFSEIKHKGNSPMLFLQQISTGKKECYNHSIYRDMSSKSFMLSKGD
jgi:hypothetical protein